MSSPLGSVFKREVRAGISTASGTCAAIDVFFIGYQFVSSWRWTRA